MDYRRFCEEKTNAAGALTEFSLHYPDDFNFAYDVADEIARTDPGRTALVWCNTTGDERVFSFEDMRRQSNRAANVFAQAGICRGDRVMVVLKRHYEYWFVALALHKLGAVMIPAAHVLTVDDLAYRLKEAQVAGVVCTVEDGVAEKVAAANERTRRSCALWCVREDRPGMANLTTLMERASEEFARRPTLAHDPMLIYFTSGTTGFPKGVIHDFSYPLAHIVTAKYWLQAEEGGLHFTVADTGWAKASWGKLYGQWLVGSAVMAFDFDNFDPTQLATVINRYGVTSFCAPPTVYRYLVRKGIPPLPTLRHATTAGENLAPEVFRLFVERTGIELREGYGQSETTLLVANFKGAPARPGSLGCASPLYRIELHDKEGCPVPAGTLGEVVVVPPKEGRQVGLLTGYLNDPEKLAHVWRGGVYHTGDAAVKDEQGSFWFYGRFDDIIKTGGYRVGPGEIEHVLMEHEAVVECGVVGIPDKFRGQAIKAYVVLVDGVAPSRELEREIRDFCNRRLAEYKWIRMMEFVQELPKTVSGKIRKVELRAPAPL